MATPAVQPRHPAVVGKIVEAVMLVLIGATPEERKELVGFQVGVRESAQSWRELLVDLKARGLAAAPEIAVGDGAMGFWKARGEVVREAKVASEPEALTGFIRELPFQVTAVGLEAGPLSQWLHKALAEAGAAVVLMETRTG